MYIYIYNNDNNDNDNLPSGKIQHPNILTCSGTFPLKDPILVRHNANAWRMVRGSQGSTLPVKACDSCWVCREQSWICDCRPMFRTPSAEAAKFFLQWMIYVQDFTTSSLAVLLVLSTFDTCTCSRLYFSSVRMPYFTSLISLNLKAAEQALSAL